MKRLGRLEWRPTTWLALGLTAFGVVAVVFGVTTSRLDNWLPNLATEAFSLAVTVLVVERIVRREAEQRVQPRTERALNVLAQAFIKFSRMAHFDYAGTHLASDLSEVPNDPIEMLRLWQEQHGNEDAPRVPARGPSLLLEEAVALVENAQRIVDADRNLLPADLVIAIDNLIQPFGGHGEPFLKSVRDPSVRRPPDSWLCLVAVNNARPVGEALRRRGALPEYPPEKNEDLSETS
jgi:hypothetical protein